MKKYKVKDLHIIETYTIKDKYYYICQYNSKNDTYREILTDTVFDGDWVVPICSLSQFYENIGRYSIENTDEITKRGIIEDTLSINTYFKLRYYNNSSKSR